MKNELEVISERYFSSEDCELHYIGNPSKAKYCINLFHDLKSFERPDMYAKYGNSTVILEHFEFDSSKCRKGSLQQADLARIERKFEKTVSDSVPTVLSDEVRADYLMENYRVNFTRSFLSHYNRYESYKQNLIDADFASNDTHFYFGFFVEDVTILGNFYLDKNSDMSEHPIILLYCDFFLDLFENSQNLDFIIFGNEINNKPHLWYIDRTSIHAYRKQQIYTDNIEIINLNPKVCGIKHSLDYREIQQKCGDEHA